MNVSGEYKKIIDVEVNNYIKEMYEKIVQKGEVVKSDNVLLICSDLLYITGSKKNDDKLKEIISNILKELCDEIYKNDNTLCFFNGMIGGIGLISFSLNILKEKGINLKNLYDFCDNLFLKSIEAYLDHIRNRPIEFMYYDIPCGMAGILNYMIEFKENYNKRIINEIVEYLIGLINVNDCGDELMKGFHIDREQQYLEREKQEMKNGNVNFGLAHGMIGVGLALAKAYSKGYGREKCKSASQKIMSTYYKFAKYKNHVILFPTQIPFEEYIDYKCSLWSFNAGWCYGNMGILMGLMRTSHFLQLQKEYKYYEKELLNVINQPKERYNLELPILCHGYAGVIAIQMGMYRESGNVEFMKKVEQNIEQLISLHKEYIKKNAKYESNFELLQGSGGVILSLADVIYEHMKYKKILMIN